MRSVWAVGLEFTLKRWSHVRALKHWDAAATSSIPNTHFLHFKVKCFLKQVTVLFDSFSLCLVKPNNTLFKFTSWVVKHKRDYWLSCSKVRNRKEKEIQLHRNKENKTHANTLPIGPRTVCIQMLEAAARSRGILCSCCWRNTTDTEQKKQIHIRIFNIWIRPHFGSDILLGKMDILVLLLN